MYALRGHTLSDVAARIQKGTGIPLYVERDAYIGRRDFEGVPQRLPRHAMAIKALTCYDEATYQFKYHREPKRKVGSETGRTNCSPAVP